MDDHNFGLLDMAIVAIPVLAICIWQLVSVNRAIAKDRERAASPERTGHAVGEHGLDDR